MDERATTYGLEPQACPFVALADDRDRRLDLPDDRHRCYAEPTPQPRALAHQRTYCLAPAFAACPIFLDWAARASAEPIATRRELPSSARLARPSDVPSSRPTDPGARDWAAPPVWTARDEQLSAFPEGPSAGDRDVDIGDLGSDPGAEAVAAAPITPPHRRPEPPAAPSTPPLPPVPADSRTVQIGEAEPPPFLAAREPADRPAAPTRPPAASVPPRFARQARHAPPKRPEDGPEWSRPRRSAAYPTLGTRVGLRGVSPIVLGAVGLAIAALVLFLAPRFLAGGAGGAPTPRPSVVAVATPTPAPTPTPEPTPQTYTVQSGDNLLKIARMFGLTVDQIACANDIRDINRLQVGQVLIVPDDEFECPATSPAP